ncbi:prohibitin family protein [Candidatus Micrarchaeota archaeon]|nr:prohibitin family protein [Candidatus Micrarchaeota archaeon]
MGTLSSGTGILVIIGLAFLLVIGIIVAITSVKIIDAGEVGVQTEFGQIKAVLQPGIYFVLPFVNDVKYLSVQIEKYETEATAASKDLQDVKTKIAVNYQLLNTDENIINTWNKFRGNYIYTIIDPITQEVVKANTAKYTADELITKRSEVKTKISSDLEAKLAVYGVQVKEVSITNFEFSPEFNKAIEQKVVAEQDKLRAQTQLEQIQIEVQKDIAQANATATSNLIKAQTDAKTKVIDAEAQANATLIKANADSAAIKTLSNTINPVYLRYAYVQRWDGVLPKVMGTNSIILDLGNQTG